MTLFRASSHVNVVKLSNDNILVQLLNDCLFCLRFGKCNFLLLLQLVNVLVVVCLLIHIRLSLLGFNFVRVAALGKESGLLLQCLPILVGSRSLRATRCMSQTKVLGPQGRTSLALGALPGDSATFTLIKGVMEASRTSSRSEFLSATGPHASSVATVPG